MLNSAVNEIVNAHKYKYQEIKHFLGSDKTTLLFFLLIKVEMATIVGIFNIYEQKKVHAHLGINFFFILGPVFKAKQLQ